MSELLPWHVCRCYGYCTVWWLSDMLVIMSQNGPLARYVKLRMRWECRERFPRHRLQRKKLVSDPGMHHGTCVMHEPWCMSGSLTRGSRHSRRMRNPQFYVSGKRPMLIYLLGIISSVIYDYHCSITMVTHKLCYCIQCHNVEYA